MTTAADFLRAGLKHMEDRAITYGKAFKEAVADGWINWNPNLFQIPVPITPIEVEFRSGVRTKSDHRHLRWSWQDNGGDIIRYRFVK